VKLIPQNDEQANGIDRDANRFKPETSMHFGVATTTTYSYCMKMEPQMDTNATRLHFVNDVKKKPTKTRSLLTP